MIMIDIPEPKKCEECPCSYLIRTGEYAGLTMCNAMEFKAASEDGMKFHEELQKYFIVQEDHRPDNCPIMPIWEVKK